MPAFSIVQGLASRVFGGMARTADPTRLVGRVFGGMVRTADLTRLVDRVFGRMVRTADPTRRGSGPLFLVAKDVAQEIREDLQEAQRFFDVR